MGVKLYRDVALGDMLARYYLDSESGSMELQLLPAGMPALARDAKRQEIDSLIQVKLAGDAYPGAYAGGGTLRQGESVRHMRFLEQTVDATERGVTISTTFQAGHQCTATHRLAWKAGERTVRSRAVFRASGEEVKLELLSSFSLGGITPYTPGDAHGSLMIHRVRSVWSMEGRLQSDSAEQLQLEPSWGGHAIRCERFGQAGSMPVNRWFPWLMVEDTKNHVFWGAQIAHNASWQMELYRKDDALAVSGGLADQEFGQWAKILAPGEAFETPEAILTVCRETSLDAAAQRLTSGQIAAVNAGPDCEQELPIIFNEYCTTWGCPSEENIAGILKAIRGKGFSYFVIDCGWFKADGVPWDISMGDYQISPTLFPGGLEKTVQAIRDEGMAPGIWFEIDNVGRASQAYQNTEHLLKRDGAPLTTSMRRFWDMRDPWVRKYLSERVIGTLKRYGFGYVKMDYNDSIGPGCDGCESLGEGLRRNMEASFAFVEQMKREIPGLVVENCASGGHKLEPKMLAATAMSSFSDAHECLEIPIIAANLHRVMLPRQSQIWAVIRKTDTPRRIVYSLAATLLGRMCVSGDVTGLSPRQWEAIDAGIAMYRKAAPVIRDGQSYWYGSTPGSYRHPTGWQGILRVGQDGALCVFHRFADAGGAMEATLLGDTEYEVDAVYGVDGAVSLTGRRLAWTCGDDWCACAVYLRRANRG